MENIENFINMAIADAENIISRSSVTSGTWAQHQINVKNKAASERIIAILEAAKEQQA